MASGAPEQLRLARRAQRDLERIPVAERARIIEDLMRLANRTFPGEVKRITSLPGRPCQADAGRFRILYIQQGAFISVLTIFARSRQRDVFRNLRSGMR